MLELSLLVLSFLLWCRLTCVFLLIVCCLNYLLRPNAASLGFNQRINTGTIAANAAVPISFGFVLPVMYTASPAEMQDLMYDDSIALFAALSFMITRFCET